MNFDCKSHKCCKLCIVSKVRELVIEMFHHKSLSKVRSQSPKWQKKRVFPIPSYRSIPDSLEVSSHESNDVTTNTDVTIMYGITAAIV